MRTRIIYGRRGQKQFFIDDKEVSRKEFDQRVPNRIEDLLQTQAPPDGARSACWPMKGSDALSVIPERIAEAQASDAKNGVPTEYTKEGQPIFRDRGHRRDYLRAYGYHDRAGGYGD